MTNEEKAKMIAEQCKPCSKDFYSGIYPGVKITLDAEEGNSISSKWVNIEDEIPSKEVLAVNKSKDFLVGYCHETIRGFSCESNEEALEDVTHWMSLQDLIKYIPK